MKDFGYFKCLNADLIQAYYGVEPKVVTNNKQLTQFKIGASTISVYTNRKNSLLKIETNDVNLEKEICELEKKLQKNGKPKIFIVYGHAEDQKQELVTKLKSWYFDPILIEKDRRGSEPIINKLRTLIKDSVAGIVLATPDDIGYRKKKDNDNNQDNPRERWRQNVVLELGMLVFELGTENTYILAQKSDDLEVPTDVDGMLRINFVDKIEDITVDLLEKLLQYHQL